MGSLRSGWTWPVATTSSSTSTVAVAATATVLVDDEVVATGQVQPDRKLPMQWLWGVSADVLRARGRLVVTGPDGARAEAALRDLV